MKKILITILMSILAFTLFAQTALFTETWEDEDAEGNWTIVNGDEVNQWVIGEAEAHGGTKSIYVSQDGGDTATYDITEESLVHFYRDVPFPANALTISLSLEIICEGEVDYYVYDYASVYLVSTDITPEAGEDLYFDLGIDEIGLVAGEDDWYHGVIQIPATWAGQTGRLVFSWYNDGSDGSGGSAIIDDISITYTAPALDAPPAPAIVVSPGNGASGVMTTTTLTWTRGAGNTPDGYRVYFSETSPVSTSGTPAQNNATTTFTPPALDPETTYYWVVIPYTTVGGDAVGYVEWSFTTASPPNTLPFDEDWEDGLGTWVLVNGDLTNHWYLGTATASEADGHSMYISNNASTHPNAYTINSPTVVHIFTDIAFPAGATEIDLSFDIKVNGESGWDYARVYLMPPTITPVASANSFSNSSSATDDPNWAYKIGDNQYSRENSWNTRNISIPLSWAGQVGRLVFSWINDTSGGDNPPAAIDNIAISAYVPQPNDPPLPVTLVNPANTGTYVSPTPELKWAPTPGHANIPDGYRVYLGTTTPPTTQVYTGTAVTYSPTLLPNTTYYWRVVPYVEYNNTQIVPTEPIVTWSFTTGLVPQTTPLTEDWENGNTKWAIINGNQTNKWVIGQATNNGGDYSIYISNDNGVTNGYANGSASYVHFFTDVTFPAGPLTGIRLSLDFIGYGENSSSYDNVRVFIVDTDVVPVAGNQTGLGTAVATYYGNTSWTGKQYSIPTSNAGTTKRIVFSWYNDSSGGSQPAAIDNIAIVTSVAGDAPLTALVSAPANNANYISITPTLSWIAPVGGNAPTGYTLYLDTVYPFTTTGIDKETSLTHAITTEAPLLNGQKYYWQVVPRNADGPATDCPVWSFTTIKAPITTLPFTEDWEDGASNWYIENGTQANQWVLGEATAAADAVSGTHSMYISYNGTANLYDNTVASTVHFFTDIAIPASITGIVINFDYKGNGQSSNDDLRVFLLPTTDIPLAGSTSVLSGAIGTYGLTPAWTNAQIVLAPGSYGNSTRRLVFSWRNNDSNGAQPPIAVDNIYFNVTMAGDPPLAARTPSPANEATDVALTPTLTWAAPAAGNTPVGYNLYLSTTNPPPTTTPTHHVLAAGPLSYTPGTALPQGTPYYWMVVPYIETGEPGSLTPVPAENCPVWSFTTLTIDPNVVTIGTGTTNTTYAPISTGYIEYSVAQMLYTSEELVLAGLDGVAITHLMYQADSAIDLSVRNEWNIRMMETEETSMGSWLDPAETIEVFNGNIGLASLSANAWLSIPLQKPFIYSGTDNLMIQIIDTKSGDSPYGGNWTASTTTGVNTVRYHSRDNTPYIPTSNSGWTAGSTSTSRPILRVRVQPPTDGLDLAISAFTGPGTIEAVGSDFSVTVTNMGTASVLATAYSVKISEVGGTLEYTIPTSDTHYIPFTTPFATTTFTIPSTTYAAWVANLAGAGEVTLKAEVIIANDDDGTNNFLTHTIFVQPEYDIAVVDLIGPSAFTLPTTASFAFTVVNNGDEDLTAADYTIKVYENDVERDITLTSVALDSGEEEDFEIEPADLFGAGFTTRNGSFTLKVEVTLNGSLTDGVPANNEATLITMLTDELADTTVTGTSTSSNIPFATSAHDNVVQSIYTPADLGGVAYGMINSIMYKFTRATGTLAPYPVNIYMANTDKAAFVNTGSQYTPTATDWVPQAQFTQVVTNYDLGLTALEAGITYDIWIPLATPFLYTGGNLVIMTHKDHEASISSSNLFLRTATDTGNFATIYKNTSSPGNNYELSLVGGTGSLYEYKPQTAFAFDMRGSTALGDVAITGFTGPVYIPPTTPANMVITVRNLSTLVDIDAEDYEIVIEEMIPNANPQLAPTWYLLATIDSETDDFPTKDVAAGSFATETITIPPAEFNNWDYQSPGGATTLRATLVFDNSFTDTVVGNDALTFDTELAPANMVLNIVDLVIPPILPAVEDISVKLNNAGRIPVNALDYTLKLYETYTVPGDPEDPQDEDEYIEHLLYTWGDNSAGAEGLADAIALGGSRPFAIENTIYNGWNFDNDPGDPFYLKFVLTYEDDDGVLVKADSLVTELRPDYDLALSTFHLPTTIPSSDSLYVIVQNNGRNEVLADSYKIEIQRQNIDNTDTDNPVTTWPTVYTLTTTDVLDIGVAKHYKIAWADLFKTAATDPFATLTGAVTLKAVVTDVTTPSPIETVTTNNELTRSSTLAPKLDLEVRPFTAPGMVPSFANITIPVRNNGRYSVAVADYTLVLNKVVATTETALLTFATATANPTVAINPGETKDFIVTPAAIKTGIDAIPAGAFSFKAVVDQTGDTVDTNDSQTRPATKSALEVDGIVEIGIANNTFVTGSSIPNLPIAIYYYDSVTQSIYTNEELGGLEAGLIKHINYRYNRTAGSTLPGAGTIDIYMANTVKAQFANTTDWVPYSEFTLVKSNFSLASAVAGINDLWFELDTPFLYEGKDLVVYAYKATSGGWNSSDGFYQTATVADSHISLNRSVDNPSGIGSTGNYDVTDPTLGTGGTPTMVDYKPQMRYGFTVSEYGILSGTITAGAAAVPGVTITQVGGGKATSSASGAFTIYIDKAVGAANIIFEKEGYYQKTLAVSTITGWTGSTGLQTATEDIVMVALPRITVKGVVTYADTGENVAGVIVHFGQFASAATGSTGAYQIANVYADYAYDITVTVTTAGYVSYEDHIFIDFDDDVVAGEFVYDIVIEEKMMQPLLVSVTLAENGDRQVRWFNPDIDTQTVAFHNPNGGLYTYNFPVPAVAFQRFPASAFTQLNLTGASLNTISFRTASGTESTDVFKIAIWTDVDPTADLDADNPSYEQDITTPIVAGAWNTVALTTVIPVPTTGELWVGVYMSLGTRMIAFRGTNTNFHQIGNLAYQYESFTSQGTTYPPGLYVLANTDAWGIQSQFLVPPARGQVATSITFEGVEPVITQGESIVLLAETGSNPRERGDRSKVDIHSERDQNTHTPIRAFGASYNVYRLAAGAVLTSTDTPLNGTTPIPEVALAGSYLDTGAVTTPGLYRYAVTAIHTGTAYDDDFIETEPTYSANLYIETRYRVDGSVIRTGGTLVGFEVTLTNDSEADYAYSPAMKTTGEDGTFFFWVPAGTYTITIHMPGLNGYGQPYGTLTDEVVVEGTMTLTPYDMTSLTDGEEITIPVVTALKGNYPNPFNPSTTIAFDLAAEGHVTIDVFNIKGQKVKTVTNELMQAGRYTVVWNGDDNNGREVGSGVYFYRMTSGHYTKTQKMLLMK